MSSYEAVTARVGALASYLLRILQVVTGILALAAAGLFVGSGAAGDWSVAAIVFGALVGGVVALAAVMVLLFARDVAKVRNLPDITAQDVQDAAKVLATSAASGERQVVEAKGWRKLLKLATGLRSLKKDLDTLADGGMAPAVALGKALVPPRLIAVSLAAVISPFLLVLGVLVLAIGLAT